MYGESQSTQHPSERHGSKKPVASRRRPPLLHIKDLAIISNREAHIKVAITSERRNITRYM
jgi:hypothetical protein